MLALFIRLCRDARSTKHKKYIYIIYVMLAYTGRVRSEVVTVVTTKNVQDFLLFH